MQSFLTYFIPNFYCPPQAFFCCVHIVHVLSKLCWMFLLWPCCLWGQELSTYLGALSYIPWSSVCLICSCVLTFLELVGSHLILLIMIFFRILHDFRRVLFILLPRLSVLSRDNAEIGKTFLGAFLTVRQFEWKMTLKNLEQFSAEESGLWTIVFSISGVSKHWSEAWKFSYFLTPCILEKHPILLDAYSHCALIYLEKSFEVIPENGIYFPE